MTNASSHSLSLPLVALTLCSAFVVLGLPSRGAADFLVNETTTGDQRRADVGTDAAGNFVVVWASDDPAPGYDPEIFGRRFDPQGQPLGTEFQVSSDAYDFERDPKVGVSDNGSFMVVWSGFDDGEFNGIFGRRYAADAMPAGAEFIVNSYTTGTQLNPEIEALADDTFVVVWTDFGGKDGSGSGLFGQRFDATGAVGNEFQLNAYTSGYQQEPKAARINSSGEFVVIWEDNDAYTVESRRFSALGVPLDGDEKIIDPVQPVHLDGFDGGFVVVWGVDSIYGRRFADDGSPLGTEFTVFDASQAREEFVTSTPAQDLDAALARHVVDPPAVAVQDDGAFLVTWSTTEVFGRRYASGGVAAGEPFTINEFTSGFQGNSMPVATGDGAFVVVWHSFDQDGQGYGVFGRRLESGSVACPTAPLGSGNCRSAGKSQLTIRNGTRDKRDLLKFRWLNGEATALEELGDPLNATSYSGCLYVDETLSHTMSAPIATLCGTHPCWREHGNNGFRYRDRAYDPAGSNGGTERLILRAGEGGSARVDLKARGSALELDALLPADPALPLLVQVHSSTGECWGAGFDPLSFKTNNSSRFKAKNP